MKYTYIDFKFELNIDESYKERGDIDKWEAAYIYIGEIGNKNFNYNYGVEYHFRIYNNVDFSSIAFSEYIPEKDYWITDDICSEYYEIDFDNPNWERDLQDTMLEYAIQKLEELDKL